MKQFQKNSQWEYYWNTLNANGTLEVNSSFMNYAEDYGIHYLVPINNSDGFVNEIILFSFDFTSDNGDGIIPLKDPICIKNTHPSTLSLQKLLGNFTTHWKLQNTGFSFAQDFLPEIQGVISRTGEKTITFQVYFTLDGENQTPWRNDIEFLISLLNIHEIVFTQCPYNYYMIMGDNCITVSFYNLSGNISYQNILPYMDKLLSQLEFSLPEVQISNPHSPWATSESPYPEFNLDNGAYIDTPLQSVPSRLGELISPQRPSPGDFYKFRNGSDFIPDYIPCTGDVDSTNAQCVIYSIAYALNILGTKNITREQIWSSYLNILGETYHEGVNIDKSYSDLLRIYFTLNPIIHNDYETHLKNGEPIIAFLPSSPNYPANPNLHAVIIVGFNWNDSYLTYYNPTTGKLHESPMQSFVRQDASFGLKKRNNY